MEKGGTGGMVRKGRQGVSEYAQNTSGAHGGYSSLFVAQVGPSLSRPGGFSGKLVQCIYTTL